MMQHHHRRTVTGHKKIWATCQPRGGRIATIWEAGGAGADMVARKSMGGWLNIESIHAKKRCCNLGCAKPEESSCFHTIQKGRASGGQDWSSLAGKVLCDACYVWFKLKGTLEVGRVQDTASITPSESSERPLPRLSFDVEQRSSTSRCSYAGCEFPERSSRYYAIDWSSRAGGQDWSRLNCWLLCKACYWRYIRFGSLEHSRPARPCIRFGSARPPLLEKCCTHPECEAPAESSQFHGIDERTTAGGRDWSSVIGHVLCHACYKRYLRSGSLKRQRGPYPTMRCAHPACEAPDHASNYHTVDGTSRPGRRDWVAVPSPLCNLCYMRFYRTGSFERGVPLIIKGHGRKRARKASSGRSTRQTSLRVWQEASCGTTPIRERQVRAPGRDADILQAITVDCASAYLHDEGSLLVDDGLGDDDDHADDDVSHDLHSGPWPLSLQAVRDDSGWGEPPSLWGGQQRGSRPSFEAAGLSELSALCAAFPTPSTHLPDHTFVFHSPCAYPSDGPAFPTHADCSAPLPAASLPQTPLSGGSVAGESLVLGGNHPGRTWPFSAVSLTPCDGLANETWGFKDSWVGIGLPF